MARTKNPPPGPCTPEQLVRSNAKWAAEKRRLRIARLAKERRQDKYEVDLEKNDFIDEFRQACDWQRSGSTCIGKLSDVHKGLPVFSVVMWQKNSWLHLQIAIQVSSEVRDIEVAEAKRATVRMHPGSIVPRHLPQRLVGPGYFLEVSTMKGDGTKETIMLCDLSVDGLMDVLGEKYDTEGTIRGSAGCSDWSAGCASDGAEPPWAAEERDRACETIKDILAPWEFKGTWLAPEAESENTTYNSGFHSFDIAFDVACMLIKDQFKKGDLSASKLIAQRHRRIGNMTEEAISEWKALGPQRQAQMIRQSGGSRSLLRIGHGRLNPCAYGRRRDRRRRLLTTEEKDIIDRRR